jgi:hypothetical protein
VTRCVFADGKIAHVREYYNPIVSAYGFRRLIAGQFYLETLDASPLS